jgi:hypothetical protein
MNYSLLVFRGHEAIGEYPFRVKDHSASAVTEPLRRLKPEFSGVILGNDGVIAHSANLPKENLWYRELILHVESAC